MIGLSAKGELEMKNRFLRVLSIAAVIMLIISGLAVLKLHSNRQKVPNVLPAVDTLVIEDDGTLVYN